MYAIPPEIFLTISTASSEEFTTITCLDSPDSILLDTVKLKLYGVTFKISDTNFKCNGSSNDNMIGVMGNPLFQYDNRNRNID